MLKWENYLFAKRKGIPLVVLFVFLIVLPLNVYASSSSNRLSGQDRFQTAKAISEQFNSGTVQDVIITSGNNFPDALSASVLAKKLNAPILLVDSKVQGSSEAFNYISQHLNKSGTVHIIGGQSIIGSDFEAQLIQLGYQGIERIGGYDRYDTNVLIAQKLAVAKNTPVVFASGENFPDALSISSIASSKGWPILLVGKDYLAQGIKDYVSNEQPSQVYIVGGTSVVSENVKSQIQSIVPNISISRLAGQNRFDTNASIIQTFAPNPKNIYFATGFGFADALAGSVLAAMTGDPIVLVDPNSNVLPPKMITYLSNVNNSKNPAQIITFGGSTVVPDSQINSADSILNVAKEGTILTSGVNLNKTIAAINVGANDTLTATIVTTDSKTNATTNANATPNNVSWMSSNTAVATVDFNGKVVGVSAGTAIIIVTTKDGGYTATCTVTVGSSEVSVTGVNLNKSSLDYSIGVKDTLTATIAPTNATNKKVTWMSSNTSVVTVDQNGNTEGVGVGTAVITVTTEDGSKTASCSVQVGFTHGDLIATVISSTQINLSWSYGNATVQTFGFNVYRSNSINGTYVKIGSPNIAEEFYADSSLNAGTTYYYKVTAITNYGEVSLGSAASATTFVIPTSVPSTISTLNASSRASSSGSNEFLRWNFLSWNYETGIISSYNIYRSNSNNGTYVKIGSATEKFYNDSLIDVGTTYYYKITANNSFGEGLGSTISVTPSLSEIYWGVHIYKSSTTIKVGANDTFTATLDTSYLTVENVYGNSNSITWMSSNTAVATVDANGKVVGVSAGTVVITVKTKAGSNAATCIVTVN
ncbi:MAG: cell wall-binding repeat-containing protein [Desulfitobacteriaceae bacterium]